MHRRVVFLKRVKQNLSLFLFMLTLVLWISGAPALSHGACAPNNVSDCTDSTGCNMVNGYWNGTACLAEQSQCSTGDYGACLTREACEGVGGFWEDGIGCSVPRDTEDQCSTGDYGACLTREACEGVGGFWEDGIGCSVPRDTEDLCSTGDYGACLTREACEGVGGFWEDGIGCSVPRDTEDLCSTGDYGACLTREACEGVGGFWEDGIGCSVPRDTEDLCSTGDYGACLTREACEGVGGFWEDGIGCSVPRDTEDLCSTGDYGACLTREACEGVGGFWEDGIGCSVPRDTEQPGNEPYNPFGHPFDFSSGTVTPLGGLKFSIEGLSVGTTLHNVIIRLNADGTWELAEEGQEEGPVNLALAMLAPAGWNSIRVRDLPLDGNLFDVMVAIEADGTWRPLDVDESIVGGGRKADGLLATLYPAGRLDNVGVDIESAATYDHYLYASVRYVTGEQYIEAWDIARPGAPVRIQRIAFPANPGGNTDYLYMPTVFMAGPSLYAVSTESTRFFIAGTDGQLAEQDSPVETSGPSSTRMAGSVMEARMPGGTASFINLANPGAPFIVKGSFGSYDGFQGPSAEISGSIKDDPVSMSLNGTRVTFTSYNRNMDTYLDVFWKPLVERIFDVNYLDDTLAALIAHTVQQADPAALMRRAMSLYEGEVLSPDLPDITLRERILAVHGAEVTLSVVLEAYGITDKDTLRFALEKIVSSAVDETFATSAGRILFPSTMLGWYDNILSAQGNIENAAELALRIKSLLESDLSVAGVERYFVKTLIAPLFDNSDAFSLTLGQAVREVTDNSVGDVIDALLLTARTLSSISDPTLLLLRAAGLDEELPLCDLPTTSRGLLELVMYDHLDLRPEGLVLFELVKLYQYFRGNDGYLTYGSELDVIIDDLHGELSESLLDALSPVFDLARSVGDANLALESYTKRFPGTAVVARAVVSELVSYMTEAGIDPDMTVGDYADSVSIGIRDHGTTVGGFIAVMDERLRVVSTGTELPVLDLPLGYVLLQASHRFKPLRNALADMLVNEVRTRFGISNINMTLEGALRSFLLRRVDLAGTVGAFVNATIGGITGDHFGAGSMTSKLPFLDLFDLAERVADGDCIAAYEIYLDAAALAALSATAFDGSATANALNTAKLALKEAYYAGLNYSIDAAVSLVVQSVFRELVGSFESRFSTFEPVTVSFDVGTYSNLTPVRTVGFVLHDKLGFVLRESYNFLDARKVSLVTLDPAMPEATALEIDLGMWREVDYVNAIEGVVLVGGQIDRNGFPRPALRVVDTRTGTPVISTIFDLPATSAEKYLISGSGASLIGSGPQGLAVIPLR